MAVSPAQAERLRSGEIFSDQLAVPAKAEGGAGDVTYLGCGCILSLAAVVAGFSTVAFVGPMGAIITFLVAETFALVYAGNIYRATHRRRDVQPVAPALAISADDRLTLNYWHGIHYLLTGSPWEGSPPRNFLLEGGTELRMLAWGPERLLSTEEVINVQAELAAVDTDELAAAYDGRAMNHAQIHSEDWDTEGTKAAMLAEFQSLRNYVTRAADRKASLVITGPA